MRVKVTVNHSTEDGRLFLAGHLYLLEPDEAQAMIEGGKAVAEGEEAAKPEEAGN
jgi:hypothetical protein